MKTYPSTPHTVYVTDYTQNTGLHSYSWSGGRSDWKGPYGKYTLQIECWNETGDQARICKVGSYYLFKNVRVKRSPTTIGVILIHRGRDSEAGIEGSLNPDQKFPHKTMVERYFLNLRFIDGRVDMSTEMVKAILKRKKEYLIRLESQIETWKKTEMAARKRAREEYPSDDETLPSQTQQLKKGSQQSKRRKYAKRKSIEEEIVAPKLSDYGTSSVGIVNKTSHFGFP